MMPGLDPRYMIAPSLEELFRDKTSGLPLAGGFVYSYSDVDRTIPKPIYQLTGSPPNYSYAVLPNPVQLTGIGSFSDGTENGNDILPYYYPYDANGNIELYYIVVTDINGVQQFTREGWPNLSASSSTAQNLINYVPNGQFLLHTNVSETDTANLPGQITLPTTILSQGGWSFDRPMSTTSKDFVTFGRFNSAVDNPTAFPRYYAQLKNISPNAGDTFKDLRLLFPDVNKFASTTQQYTYSFSMLSNGSGSVSLQVILIKNFGTGGSTTTETVLGTVTATTSYTTGHVTFTFGTNEAKTIGVLDNDYVQLAIRFPTDSVFDISLTDFILTPGQVVISQYPSTPENETIYSSIAGWNDIPAYDGSSLFLPLILTPTGIGYDPSSVGSILTNISTTAPVSYLPCNASQYETAAYSTDGIPYARLWAKLWVPSLNLPLYNTGTNYFVAQVTTNMITVTNNNTGTVTGASDGTPATGFTFLTTIATYQVVTITTVAGSAIPAGAYFNIYSSTGASSIHYYVWFTKDGIGTDPKPMGATSIGSVAVLSTDTNAQVATKIQIVMNSKFYATPDYRGVFFRVWDDGRGLDPDTASRTSKAYANLTTNPITGDKIGTFQDFQIQAHTHTYDRLQSFNAAFLNSGLDVIYNQIGINTGSTGGNETRSVNEYINVFIKY